MQAYVYTLTKYIAAQNNTKNNKNYRKNVGVIRCCSLETNFSPEHLQASLPVAKEEICHEGGLIMEGECVVGGEWGCEGVWVVGESV